MLPFLTLIKTVSDSSRRFWSALRCHHLSPVAALITELCDGSHSVEEIRDLAGSLMPEGKMGEVDRWIDDAMKVGLLTWQGRESGNRGELSGADLYTLPRRFKKSKKVQTAYLCGKRVVELKPDDWDAWYDLGEICQCVGRREEARAAYQKYFEAHPEDAEIEHLLVALRDDAPPPRTSDRAIQQIYKGFAASYEVRMLEDLKYQGPERLSEGISSVIGESAGLAVLDLGCGSGLAGTRLKSWAGQMTGVDLAPEMIALAGQRNIYDRLEVGEITEWLQNTAEQIGRASCRERV